MWDNEHEDEREESAYAKHIGTVQEEKETFPDRCWLCCLCFYTFGVLHANPFAPAGNPEPTASSDSSGYQATVLRQFKSKYVGDHVNVGNLLRNLPYAQYLKGGISLQTENTPYGINVNYDFMQSNNSVNNADDNTGNKPDGDAGLDLDQ